MKLLYTVQYNVMYKYTFYHALYSVRVSISYYVLHVAMLVLLIDYSSCCLLFVVSHNQRIGCQPKKLLYTVANPARGLLNREKRTT